MAAKRFILANDAVRRNAMDAIRTAPTGWRVEIAEPRRSLPQNARFWAALGDVAKQVEHNGRRYDAEAWKAIFMHALGKQTEFAPSLDGSEIVPLGYRSSELARADMAELIELIYSFGAERDVVWSEDARRAA
ncbi:MAG: recombination protein NinB [Beijerinckiaceae bacterium]|nr:recombination protein NinB [Beijerinckiaceae bacterium]